MKGGKEGRKRRSASGAAARKSGGRGAKQADAKRQWSDAPKKGEKKHPRHGGRSSSGEE